MNVQSLKKQLAEKEFVLKSIMFLEDGYVMRCKIVEKDFEDDAEYEMYVESAIDRIYAINFDGFIVSEILIERDVFAITLVPKSLEEMTDFIWKYVEKYGKMEDCLKDILSDAFSALEKAIDEIPSNYAGRDVAKVNYDKFSGMIF